MKMMNRRRMSVARLVGIVAAMVVGGVGVAGLGVREAAAQVAVKGKVVHTMGAAGTITDGVVVIEGGKIKAVGPAASTAIPAGMKVIEAAVVTPGLIDGRCTAGLSGIFNQKHDSDQIEGSSPIQPELRAIDAYNAQEPLVAYLRSFGITTIHTGHAPGELISGQTMIVKTRGKTVDEAKMVDVFGVAATLGPASEKSGGKSPGTRSKQVSMLREQLIKAQEYAARKSKPGADEKVENEGEGKEKGPKGRDLKLEVLVRVLKGELPLIVTAQRAQDIDSALRIGEEFKIRVILDGAAEAYTMLERIKQSGVSVLVHPTMTRAFAETENLSMENASKLLKAGVPTALQGGYEAYVPKVRVVLWEAGAAAANGCSQQQALSLVTINAAKLLGIDARVGSLEAGKDGDVAIFDGDPLEYTSHCVGAVIEGKVESEVKR